jgi:Flp pilus assembly protein TadB
MLALFLLCVFGFIAGLAGLGRLLRNESVFPRAVNTRLRRRRHVTDLTGLSRNVLGAAIAAIVVGGLTRWPVAAGLAAAVVIMWPRFARGGAQERAALAKIEALATWTESLRDTAAADAALETAIPATVADAPRLLVPALRDLSQSLARMEPLPTALRRFADAVADRGADLVVTALSENARVRAGSLRRVLTTLAANTRNELEIRREEFKAHNALRRQAKQITGLVLGLAVGQKILLPEWVAPYGTPLGQVLLGVEAVVYLLLLERLQRLATPEPQPRFLEASSEFTRREGGVATSAMSATNTRGRGRPS